MIHRVTTSVAPPPGDWLGHDHDLGRDAAELPRHYQMFVDGAFVDGADTVTVVNPATERVLTEVSAANSADVTAAVRGARRAFDKVWSRASGPERARRLFRVARLIQEHERELAVLECLQSGTPVRQCREVTVPAAAAQFFHHAGWADKLNHAGFGPGPRPMGVCGQITTADSALLVAAALAAPALACGNTVVIKPADEAPLTILALADLCRQAGVPAGVLNVLPGTDDVAAALAAQGGLDLLEVIGSADTGQRVRRAATETTRRLRVAVGRPADLLVFEDAPLRQAVDGIVAAAFRPIRPGCRLFVQESVAGELLAALHVTVRALRVGDPLDERTDVGPVSSTARRDRIRALLADTEDGAPEHWTSPAPLPETGYFLAPTTVTKLTPGMRLAREELLGPVVPVWTFRTPDDALALVNQRPTAGCASVWSGRTSRLRWTMRRMRAGALWANTAPRIDPAAVWGRYQDTGLGRAGDGTGLGIYLDGV